MRCPKAEEVTVGGWWCSRDAGHSGPCAAYPSSLSGVEQRWPTLAAIGLAEALDAVERVARWAQEGKHPGPKWATQTTEHQAGKLVKHLGYGLCGDTQDEDTGEHPYAHAAARALMLLGLVLKK